MTGDLALPPDQQADVLVDFNDIRIVLENGPLDASGHVSTIIAKVFGACEDASEARELFRTYLARHLDLLSIVTLARYKITRNIRQVDWEPYQKERVAKVFSAEHDARYTPEFGLKSEYLRTVSLLRPNVPDFMWVALKYFRYGLLDSSPADQFMRFWLSLEILAENTKERARVPVTCPKCQGPLRCEPCDESPTRMPMATQAIEEMLVSLWGQKRGSAAAKRHRLARNGLVHGRRESSIEKDCGMSMDTLVNELARATWDLLVRAIPETSGEPQRVFTLPQDGVVVNRITGVADLLFEHKDETEHPSDAKIPNAKLEVISRLKPDQ